MKIGCDGCSKGETILFLVDNQSDSKANDVRIFYNFFFSGASNHQGLACFCFNIIFDSWFSSKKKIEWDFFHNRKLRSRTCNDRRPASEGEKMINEEIELIRDMSYVVMNRNDFIAKTFRLVYWMNTFIHTVVGGCRWNLSLLFPLALSDSSGWILIFLDTKNLILKTSLSLFLFFHVD